jgi:hypothetical protein
VNPSTLTKLQEKLEQDKLLLMAVREEQERLLEVTNLLATAENMVFMV